MFILYSPSILASLIVVLPLCTVRCVQSFDPTVSLAAFGLPCRRRGTIPAVPSFQSNIFLHGVFALRVIGIKNKKSSAARVPRRHYPHVPMVALSISGNVKISCASCVDQMAVCSLRSWCSVVNRRFAEVARKHGAREILSILCCARVDHPHDHIPPHR